MALYSSYLMNQNLNPPLQTSMYSVVAPRKLLTVTAKYAAPASMVFYTDGFLIYGCARFAFYRTREVGFGYKISSPAGIFTAEITVFFCDTATYWGGYSTPEKMPDFV
jgi:hypothetical protein